MLTPLEGESLQPSNFSAGAQNNLNVFFQAQVSIDSEVSMSSRLDSECARLWLWWPAYGVRVSNLLELPHPFPSCHRIVAFMAWRLPRVCPGSWAFRNFTLLLF